MTATRPRAVVIGASGGIGSALVAGLAAQDRYRVEAWSRSGQAIPGADHSGRIDLTDEPSIAAAATHDCAPLGVLIIATGLLHEGDRRPERRLAELDAEWLARNFAVNTIGPALAIKHFASRLPRSERGVIAALSARVGSIADNRLGGWYGYRAAKAALNQIVRTASIEIARTRPHAVVAALHPGTVATGLSAPFQGNVSPEKLFAPEQSAAYLLAAIDRLQPNDSGRIFAWDGAEIAP